MKTNPLRGAALALAITLAFTTPARAAPASQASVEALFQLMHLDTMFDTMFDAMQQQMSKMVAQDTGKHGESPARQQIQEKARQDVMALVHSELNSDFMKSEMVDAYEKNFTEEEVTAMINFYSTPAGQATITKAPQLMQSMMVSTQARMQSLMPRLRAIEEKARADADAADAAH